jgi:multicomponent Na+:H+ antiporter subunit D
MTPQILPFFVIIPVLLAVFLYIFFTAKIARVLAILAQGLMIVPAFLLLVDTRYDELIGTVGDFYSLLGITLRADNLASVFVLLTVVIFFALGIYTLQTPFDKTKRLYLFLVFLLQGALIGLFLTRDFFNIFVLVEVTTVVVTILLMYDNKRRNLFAGMTFIMVNILVMQFYLFGLGYLYMITGVMDMEAAAYAIAEMYHRDIVLPYALIMTAVASKCSLLPMLTWLPKVNSLTGSRFTIAAIMSGLHIKSGVYLFIRFQDLFGGIGSEFWIGIGITTAVAGVILALSQNEIRLMLAYSTIAQVGLIIVGLSIYNEYSFIGSIFHIVNHAIFKVALFLCASQISFIFGTKDMRKMRGAFKLSPVIATANIIVIFGIIGAPMFNGSISKYFLMYGASGWLEWVIIAINLGTVLVFVKYSEIFFGTPSGEVRRVERDWYRIPVVIGLGVATFILGIFGAQVIDFLFNMYVSVSFWGYIEKVGIFFGSIAVATALYYFVIRKRDFWLMRKLDGFNISFQKICVSIGVFFAGLIGYFGWVI